MNRHPASRNIPAALFLLATGVSSALAADEISITAAPATTVTISTNIVENLSPGAHTFGVVSVTDTKTGKTITKKLGPQNGLPVDFGSFADGTLMGEGEIILMGGETASGPVTWLGVSVERVSDDLRAHVAVEKGVGLIVRDVPKDSPAEKAGLKVNDILTRLDDQILVTEDQLRALVATKADGDVVTLKGLRQGKDFSVQPKLVTKTFAPGEGAAGGCQIKATGTSPVVIRKFIQGGQASPALSKELSEAVQKATEEAMKRLAEKSAPASGNDKAAGKGE
ncbi:MAG: PDZ domain-containing protein [Kiritimatiellia bacterium]